MTTRGHHGLLLSSGGAWVAIVTMGAVATETGWGTFTQRQRFGSALVVAGTKVRLTIRANATYTVNVGAMYVGIGATSGDNYDFAATPAQVTFGGLGTGSVTSGELVSDEIPLTIAGGDALLIATYMTGTSSVPATTAPNRNSYYKSGNDASTVNATGYSTSVNNWHLISKVEIFQP